MTLEMPNLLRTAEQDQWLKGKPTREDLFEVIQEVLKVSKSTEALQELLAAQSRSLSQIFQLTRITGLQNETLVRMMEKAVPGYRENYELELGKTFAMVAFLDDVNSDPKPGKEGEKVPPPISMREKINKVLEWNRTEGNIPVEAKHFGLSEYIAEHPAEFTEEEILGWQSAELNIHRSEIVTAIPEVSPAKEEEASNVGFEPH